MEIAVARQHIDRRVRLDKPLSHSGEDRPLILVDPTPVGPTSERWVDQVAALIMPQSEVGAEQASRLELLEEVHDSLSHPDVALRKPVGVEKDTECWWIMCSSPVGLNPFAIARKIHRTDDGASEAGGGEAAVSVLSKARLFRMASQSASLM